jgi:hypothetical protein
MLFVLNRFQILIPASPLLHHRAVIIIITEEATCLKSEELIKDNNYPTTSVTDVMILKIFLPKFLAKKLAFLTPNNAKF